MRRRDTGGALASLADQREGALALLADQRDLGGPFRDFRCFEGGGDR